jgi:hypothetical protein
MKMHNTINHEGNAYHLTSVRLANTKMTKNNKCLQKCGEKGTFAHY